MTRLTEALDWPKDKPLPENPEEWPLIPKMKLLAEYADRTDDARGAGPEQRTVQADVRKAIAVLEAVVEGVPIQWCVNHGLPAAAGIEDVCAIGYMPLHDPFDEDDACSIVSRLLVNYPKEDE